MEMHDVHTRRWPIDRHNTYVFGFGVEMLDMGRQNPEDDHVLWDGIVRDLLLFLSIACKGDNIGWQGRGVRVTFASLYIPEQT
jgi:hypothetical protein